MSIFAELQTLSYALGWALIHSLWQGATVALLLAALMRLLRGHSANIRYLAACASLLLVLVLPAATALRINATTQVLVDESALPAAKAAIDNANVASVEIIVHSSSYGLALKTAGSAGSWLTPLHIEPVLPWMTSIWLIGVALLSLRLAGGLLQASRLKRRATRNVTAEWQQSVANLCERLRVSRPVALLESSFVKVPTVVGWLRPVILLPASAIAGLTPAHLEVIVAHELAHVRRYDYLVNMLQSVAETLLFYHPAVWWISRQIRMEREHACDDLAIAACGDAIVYARALTQLERLRASGPQLAMAASGGSLLGRIHRIIDTPPAGRTSSPLVVSAIACALLLTFLCAGLTGPNRGSDVVAAAEKKQAAAKPQRQLSTKPLSAELAQLVARDITEGEDEAARQAVVAALGNRAGTVVVMDARTGQVRTIVNQDWALRRGWLPASTFKMVTALAGVAEKSIDPAERVRVSEKSTPINLTEALAISSNDYFKLMAARVGTEKMISYARQLGLGEPTGINLANEYAGRLPDSSQGLDASAVGAHGDEIQVTPLQLATLMAALANGGDLLVPQLARAGTTIQPQVRRRINIDREAVAVVKAGLVESVKNGTGKAAADPTIARAGKTGTFRIDGTNVGIFAAYSPADDPRTVVVVLTRGKKENGPASAEIVGKIFKSLD